MLASERFLYILEALEKDGVITLKAACNQLQASESTVRRDFEELEKQNKLKRVHGGVVKVSLGTTLTVQKELTMIQKQTLHVDAKKSICKKCAEFVEDGDCIFIDGGTTHVYLPQYLEGKRVKIVTHNNFVTIPVNSTLELIRVGGDYISSYNMNVGTIAADTLRLFNFDYAFIGCAGIDVHENIAYTAEMASAQIKTIAMEQSLKSYLLVDLSKLDTRGFYKFCKIDAFDGVMMDQFPANRKKPKNIIICD